MRLEFLDAPHAKVLLEQGWTPISVKMAPPVVSLEDRETWAGSMIDLVARQVPDSNEEETEPK